MNSKIHRDIHLCNKLGGWTHSLVFLFLMLRYNKICLLRKCARFSDFEVMNTEYYSIADTKILFHSNRLSCLPVVWFQTEDNCIKCGTVPYFTCTSFLPSQEISFSVLSKHHFWLLSVKKTVWTLWFPICFWESGVWCFLSFIFPTLKYYYIETQLILNTVTQIPSDSHLPHITSVQKYIFTSFL